MCGIWVCARQHIRRDNLGSEAIEDRVDEHIRTLLLKQDKHQT